jgi:cation diffusion facilitator family transporter
MHSHALDRWQHRHFYLGEKHEQHERRTWIVVALTAVTMVAEIVGGHIYGSMALVADGWHMSTHAGALAIAALAYRFARKHAHDPRFSFGTGKLGELAGFASAVILAVVALIIAYESFERLFAPVSIRFEQAIVIAVIGLAVNLGTAWILYDSDHHKQHTHAAGDDHVHTDTRDHNISAAYFHVLGDALTSVLAIAALLAGWLLGWTFMDPLMGIVGALVIAHWSLGLIRAAGAVLVDVVPDGNLAALVRKRLEVDGDRVADMHLWRVGPGHAALIATVVSDRPQEPDAYKGRLAGVAGLSHVTIEVHRCCNEAAA